MSHNRERSLEAPFFYKSIRADEFDFWGSFVYSVTKSQVTWAQPKANAPLRMNLKRSYGWRVDGCYRVGQDPLFTLEQKKFHSKHQSFSYADPTQSYYPSVFGWGKRDCLVGVEMAVEGALIQRIMNSDLGSAYRPYQAHSPGTTRSDFAIKNYQYPQTLEGMVKYNLSHSIYRKILSYDESDYNEVMVRAKWSCEKQDAIVIFSDTPEARLLAQIRAIDLQNRLRQMHRENNEECKACDKPIPIRFYLPSNANKRAEYTQEEQKKDFDTGVEEVNKALEAENKAQFTGDTSNSPYRSGSLRSQYVLFLKLQRSNFESFDGIADVYLQYLVLFSFNLAAETNSLFYQKLDDRLREDIFYTIIRAAIQKGCLEYLKVVLNKRRANQLLINYVSLLSIAVSARQFEIVDYLLVEGIVMGGEWITHIKELYLTNFKIKKINPEIKKSCDKFVKLDVAVKSLTKLHQTKSSDILSELKTAAEAARKSYDFQAKYAALRLRIIELIGTEDPHDLFALFCEFDIEGDSEKVRAHASLALSKKVKSKREENDKIELLLNERQKKLFNHHREQWLIIPSEWWPTNTVLAISRQIKIIESKYAIENDFFVQRARKLFLNALQKSDIDYIKKILTLDPEAIQLRAEKDISLVSRALYYGHEALADCLVQSGATLDVINQERDSGGNSILMHAIQDNYVAGVKLLLRNGADVHAVNHAGDTVIHCAMRSMNCLKMVKILIAAGADLNKQNFDGYHPVKSEDLFSALNREAVLWMLPKLDPDHVRALYVNAIDTAKYLFMFIPIINLLWLPYLPCFLASNIHEAFKVIIQLDQFISVLERECKKPGANIFILSELKEKVIQARSSECYLEDYEKLKKYLIRLIGADDPHHLFDFLLMLEPDTKKLSEIRQEAYTALTTKVSSEEGDPDAQLALLKTAKEKPIFSLHRNHSIFKGAFGKTRTVKKMDLQINQIEKGMRAGG